MKKQQKSSNLRIAVTVTLITASALAFDIWRRAYRGGGCIIKALFGFACPACGMTRAHLALLRLDFAAAFAYHPAWWTAGLAAATCILALADKKRQKLWGVIFALDIAILIAVWIFRLVTGTAV